MQLDHEPASWGPLFLFWLERHLPFVPALIIPYMSIDLFFVIAPFLAKSSHELRTFSLRIATAILLAGGCFLLFPLKFAFNRPHVDGPLGLIFNNFRNLDLPFNQCPSLHIALWAILIHHYFRHSRGMVRALILIWFSLILLSTVLTYQHHLIDVAGGFVLSTFCFYLYPDEPLQRSETFSRQIAAYYGIGAIVLSVFSLAYVPWSYILIWPAVSLAIAAIGYVSLGSNIFRKRAGIIPLSARLVMMPVLLGQRFSLAYYASQCRACDCLTDRLWIGRHLTHVEASELRQKGITAVIDLASEMSESKLFRSLNYLQMTVPDLTAPNSAQIEEALGFIQHYAGDGMVYLHCKAGYSRTAVIAGAYLLATGRAENVDHAVALLRQARPSIIIRPEAMNALQDYHGGRNTILPTHADVPALLHI